MLVLTRKPGQSVLIGDGIEVQVLSVSGAKIRIGITAPRDVSILRNEVLERIQDEDEGGPPKNCSDPVDKGLERLSSGSRRHPSS